MRTTTHTSTSDWTGVGCKMLQGYSNRVVCKINSISTSPDY